MRVIGIGDVHTAPGDRNADKQAAVEHIIDKELSAPRPVGLWVLLGDLSHGLQHGRMQPEIRNWWGTQIQRMAQAAPVLIVYGNHDIPGDLDLFAAIAAPYPIRVVWTPGVVDIVHESEALRVCCLPYPHKAGQIAAGATLDEARAALFTLCQQGAAALEDAAQTLVVGHLNISGAISSVGQPQIGSEIELDASALAQFSLMTPKIFGHIHKAQAIAGGFYAGSVCPMDWGETEPKSYLVVEYPERGAPIVTREQIPCRPMYHVDLSARREEDGTLSLPWVVRGETPAPATWVGCDVRVRYTYPASQRDVVPVPAIRALFAEASMLKLEPVAVPDRAVRAPAVAAAVSLEDKVLAWAEEAHRALTPEAADRVRQGLHTLQGATRETVIAAVAARLKAAASAAVTGRRA